MLKFMETLFVKLLSRTPAYIEVAMLIHIAFRDLYELVNCGRCAAITARV